MLSQVHFFSQFQNPYIAAEVTDKPIAWIRTIVSCTFNSISLTPDLNSPRAQPSYHRNPQQDAEKTSAIPALAPHPILAPLNAKPPQKR